MKKILILSVLLLVGCSNNNYSNFVKEAKESTITDNIPCDVKFNIDDTDEDMIYQVVIDNCDYELNDVSAIVIHNKENDNGFPSIGVIDDKINLNNETKGINLVGYVKKQDNIEFKLYLKANNTSYAYNFSYNF